MIDLLVLPLLFILAASVYRGVKCVWQFRCANGDKWRGFVLKQTLELFIDLPFILELAIMIVTPWIFLIFLFYP